MHAARHTAITDFLRFSGNRKLTEQLARHRDISTTANIYKEQQSRERCEQTKAALQRAGASGVIVGRPSGVSDEIRDRIREERKTKSLQAIADGLNADEVPTSHGGSHNDLSQRKAPCLRGFS